MKYKVITLIRKWLELREPLQEGEKYTIKNPLVIIKKKGTIKLSNGYEVFFDREKKNDVLGIVYFALSTGISFGNKIGQWKFDQKNGIIETHQGIRFSIRGSFGIFNETFLSQIHFSGFDMNDKVVVTAGAYIGDTPLFYSYYGARVYAFEPDPHSFRTAEKNIALNPDLKKNIFLKNHAIGLDGEVDFPLESDSVGSSVYETKNKETVRTKSVSVSTILKEFNITKPYLLDLDIKGLEFTVVDDESISNFEKIRIEYSPYFLSEKDKSLDCLIAKLESYGFNKIRIYKHSFLRFDLINHGTIEAQK